MYMPNTFYNFPDFNVIYTTFETKIEEEILAEEKPIYKTIALIASNLFANNAQASFFSGDFKGTTESCVGKSIHHAVENTLMASKGIFPNFALKNDTAQRAETFFKDNFAKYKVFLPNTPAFI